MAVAAMRVRTDDYDRPDELGIHCDVTDTAGLSAALETTIRAFGRLDMLILNAGIFPSSRAIAAFPPEEWDAATGVNLALLRYPRPCAAKQRLWLKGTVAQYNPALMERAGSPSRTPAPRQSCSRRAAYRG